MPLPRKERELMKIKDEICYSLVQKGLDLSDIGYIFGVTKQAVWLAVGRHKKRKHLTND